MYYKLSLCVIYGQVGGLIRWYRSRSDVHSGNFGPGQRVTLVKYDQFGGFPVSSVVNPVIFAQVGSQLFSPVISDQVGG